MIFVKSFLIFCICLIPEILIIKILNQDYLLIIFFIILSVFQLRFIFLNFYIQIKHKLNPDFKLKTFAYDNLTEVDVYITVFAEPLEVIQQTIKSALDIDWTNKNIHLLDDGRRGELRLLAEKFKINYITRESNEGAKAGNINNALEYTTSPYILFMDSDTIVPKDIIHKLIKHLGDNIWLVQATVTSAMPLGVIFPKSSISSDDWNEQAYFFKLISPVLSITGDSIWCGAGGLARRDLLVECNGVETYSLTEDTATSKKMQFCGYDAHYVSDVEIKVQDAYDYKSYLSQRQRWNNGNFQVTRRVIFKTLFYKRLSFIRKLVLIADVSYPVDSFCYFFMVFIMTFLVSISNLTQLQQFTCITLICFMLVYKQIIINLLFSKSTKFSNTLSYFFMNSLTAFEGNIKYLLIRLFNKKMDFIITNKSLNNQNNLKFFLFTCFTPLTFYMVIVIILNRFFAVNNYSIVYLVSLFIMMLGLILKKIPLNIMMYKRKVNRK